MAAPAAILQILVNANTGPAIRGLVQVNSQLSATEKKSQKAAKAIGKVALAATAIGGAAVVGGLAYATKKAADFEEQISRLGAVADASDRQMERFRKQALKAGADTKFSALEAAAAQTELAKGGLSVAQIMKGGLKSALALAAAGEMELADAAEATVNAIKLFGLRGKDAMKVADGFATAANRTTADVSDFALALKMGGSAAKAAGLTFSETTTMLGLLAEAGIKGSDAGTSLKSALVQISAPTIAAERTMHSLGISFFDAQGNMKGLADISEMLRKKLGGMTREQRLATVKTIAGTDGLRALLSVYDAGPRKIAAFEESLKKEGTAADVAKKKQDNLKGSLETLQGSIETLGIQIGTGLLPIFRKGADELTGFANDVGKIVDRKDLSIGEKLQKSLDLAKVRAQPWVDKLSAALEEANIPEKVGRLFSAAIPVIAEAFAKGAPVIAQSFVKGFLAADVWGRIAIVGWLLARMGGPPAFLKLGTSAGAAMGAGMAVGAATAGPAIGAAVTKSVITWTRGPGGAMLATVGTTMGGQVGKATGAAAGTAAGAAMPTAVAKSGAKAKMLGVVKGWGPTLAIGLAAVFGPELAKALQKAVDPKSLEFELPKTRGKVGQFIAEIDLNPFTAARENIAIADEALRKFGSTAEAQFKKFKAAGDTAGLDRLADRARKLAEDFPKASGALRRFAGAITNVSERRKDIEATEARVIQMGQNISRAMRRMRGNTKDSWDQMVDLVAQGSRKMLRTGGRNSERTREAIHDQFELAARQIKRALNKGVISAEEATSRLRELARKELKLYGISAGRVDVVLAKGANGQMRPTQKGAYINEGKTTGDSVPALLEKGEYVLNRNAVKKVGKQALDRLNYAQAPRFQVGGIVELLHPGNDANHQDHLHVATATVDAIVALGKRLQKMGWLVGEHPAFGGVAAVHTQGSYHYSGRAIDVNWPTPAEEKAKIAALLPLLGGNMGALGRTFEGLKKPQIRGPLSTNLEAAQGMIDRVYSAANAKVASIVNVDEGIEGLGNFTGPWTKIMAKIAQAKGWSLSDWRSLVQKESGGNPNARNPSSGAYGLGQFLGATARSYAKYGALSSDGSDQIRAMAQYISDRYGTPSAALAFHNANNWYREGGPVGMDTGGDPLPRGQQINPKTGVSYNFKRQIKAWKRNPFKKMLEQYTSTSRAKVRKSVMSDFLDKSKDIGLPVTMRRALKKHSDEAARFGEFADRAASLTDETSITEALQAEMDRRGGNFPDGDQQAMVDQMSGRVSGKTQLDWLKDQLQALFNWRNAMIDAENKIVEIRNKVTEAIEFARKQVERIQKQLKENHERKDRLESRLKVLQKHPKQNEKAIKVTRAELKSLNEHIKIREGVQDKLKDPVIKGLVERRSALNTRRGELISSLDEVQGSGAGMERWTTLPADIGATGGSIFDTRLKIREMTDKPIRVTAEASSDTATTPGAEELRDLLRQANLRTAVSQAQYQVFKDMPSFGGGGVVPGPAGSPRVIEAHGREVVLTPEQASAMGGGGAANVHLHFAPGTEWLKNFVQVEVERGSRTASRRASRGLPSAGGGLR
jgi:TP901 family phage tail tape measure protein